MRDLARHLLELVHILAHCRHCGRTPKATRRVAGGRYCAQGVDGRPACAVLAEWAAAEEPEQSWWDWMSGGRDQPVTVWPSKWPRGMPERGAGATERHPGVPGGSSPVSVEGSEAQDGAGEDAA